MREFLLGKSTANSEDGPAITCAYKVTIDESGGRLSCECYGIKVEREETGEIAQVRDLTVSSDRILALGNTLMRNAVTPCALGDVIADWL